MRNSEKPMFDLPTGEVFTTGPMGRTKVSEDFRTRSNLIDAQSIYTPSKEPNMSTAYGWQGHEGVGVTGWGPDSYGDVTSATERTDPYMLGLGSSPVRRKR